jgi:hypothetical protein
MDFEFLSGMLLPQNILMGVVVFTKVRGLAKLLLPFIFCGSVPL